MHVNVNSHISVFNNMALSVYLNDKNKGKRCPLGKFSADFELGHTCNENSAMWLSCVSIFLVLRAVNNGLEAAGLTAFCAT